MSDTQRIRFFTATTLKREDMDYTPVSGWAAVEDAWTDEHDEQALAGALSSWASQHPGHLAYRLQSDDGHDLTYVPAVGEIENFRLDCFTPQTWRYLGDLIARSGLLSELSGLLSRKNLSEDDRGHFLASLAAAARFIEHPDPHTFCLHMVIDPRGIFDTVRGDRGAEASTLRSPEGQALMGAILGVASNFGYDEGEQ